MESEIPPARDVVWLCMHFMVVMVMQGYVLWEVEFHGIYHGLSLLFNLTIATEK